MVFPVVMSACESWTIRKAEHRRIDAFELWCWRRLSRVPWTARRTKQSILKEISPGCSLEGLMLKLKLQYSGHLMWRANSFEKTLMLGKTEGGRRKGWQRMRWLDGIYLEPVCCSMSSSNCCFLTCIKVSQEAGQVVWYSHLFQNFPQFIVIHTVKGFGIVNKAEIDVFLELSCFFNDPTDHLAIWSLFPLLFINPAWTTGSSWSTYCWSLAWRVLSTTLLACEMSAIVR